MGLQKNPGIKGQSAPTTPVRRVAQGRLKAGYSHSVRQNRQSKSAGSLGSRSQKSRRRVRGQSSGPGVIPGPPLRYLLRPGSRGGPSATGPSEAPPPRGHSAAPTCRLHAGPPRHCNAPAHRKCCRELWCFPRVRPVCHGTFEVASRVPSTVSHFKTERGNSLEML